MIVKLIGAGIILLSSVGFLLSRELEFSQHKKQLEEFGLLLALWQNEICLLRLPLVQVLEHCSMRLQPPFQELCLAVRGQLLCKQQGGAEQIWRETLAGQRGSFLLDAGEFKLLAEAGEALSMGNAKLKEELFSVYQMRLERLQAGFEERLAAKRRLNRFGSLLAGVFLIILFI